MWSLNEARVQSCWHASLKCHSRPGLVPARPFNGRAPTVSVHSTSSCCVYAAQPQATTSSLLPSGSHAMMERMGKGLAYEGNWQAGPSSNAHRVFPTASEGSTAPCLHEGCAHSMVVQWPVPGRLIAQQLHASGSLLH